jgi:hypothetical protein
MFIQVIQGSVTDADLLARQLQRWRKELKPGATGYLGSTGGVTPDGRGITMVRFESGEAARANSERREQSAWWAETEKAFGGDVAFHESTDVDVALGGGSNDAGFVQVFQGRAKDQTQLRARLGDLESQLRESRPDILGFVVAWHDDGGGFTQAVYFTSEAAARKGEQGTQADREEMMAMMDGALTFFDLPDPDLD